MVLGALLGASIFISSVVLGSVLLAAPTVSVDKETFRRDVFAYLVTVVIIVGIAHDGDFESKASAATCVGAWPAQHRRARHFALGLSCSVRRSYST